MARDPFTHTVRLHVIRHVPPGTGVLVWLGLMPAALMVLAVGLAIAWWAALGIALAFAAVVAALLRYVMPVDVVIRPDGVRAGDRWIAAQHIRGCSVQTGPLRLLIDSDDGGWRSRALDEDVAMLQRVAKMIDGLAATDEERQEAQRDKAGAAKMERGMRQRE